MVNYEEGYKSPLDIKYSLKEKILKFLIENKQEWTILEIAKKLKKDYKNTFQAINSLYPELIYKNKKGNINLIEIKLAKKNEIYLVEGKRTKEFLKKHKKLKLIKEDIESINYPYLIVLLFGSYANNKETQKSDIDLCIIADNKEKTKEILSRLELLSLPIEIQNFTILEFESMLNKKENNLGKEIIINNIILFGIENYYNLISKWMKRE